MRNMSDYAENLMQIVECPLCDDAGMRGLYRCDHIDYAAIARRHMPTIREVLKKGSK